MTRLMKRNDVLMFWNRAGFLYNKTDDVLSEPPNSYASLETGNLELDLDSSNTSVHTRSK